MVEPSNEITDAFTVLADTRRRYALYYLTRQEPPVSFESLVSHVAGWETDTAPDAVDDATLDAVGVELHHVHLPMLSEHGVVTYKANPGEIELVDDTDALQFLLDVARRSEFGEDVSTREP
ncbi:DUF7344 domain-containing protein [Natrinema gelatinilyticum]|uniref:DUF7344 domain-containing protein n=1 Tax=Natrinema gelatinilyticum TaxID=2961571 RepID=UPI0020C4FC0E|nr:hypothetical protein [Natrinema gelatinilyticum]